MFLFSEAIERIGNNNDTIELLQKDMSELKRRVDDQTELKCSKPS